MSLADVPAEVIDVVKNQPFYYFIRQTGITREIPFEAILHPCVVFQRIYTSTDPSIMLVAPCKAIHEFN